MHMALIVQFCGGVGTVTGSMHLITSGRHKILIDAGLFQGKRDDFYKENSNFPFEPSAVNACIISHAHIDHCGNFPTLVKKGFRSHAYLTPTTKELCQYMLPDSGHIQEEDIKYVNKINKRRGLPPRFPLYDQRDAEKSIKYFKKLNYHETNEIAPNINLTFYDSGHILGSSIPVIDIKDEKGSTRIAYAVDLGRPNLPFLRNPESPSNIDYLIIESTYGARSHPKIEEAEGSLAEVINRTVKRGGKIIIPSFALERTQEVLYFIVKLIKRKIIKPIPIYIDSPLAINITNVFRGSWEYFDKDIKKFFSRGQELFDSKNVTYVKSVNESKKLHNINKPLVIISASGMCENGRILHHLKNNIENPNNTIIIVGFMAQNTLGRKIVEKNRLVNIFGRPYQLKAEVVKLNEFSAHADKQCLVNYVKECGSQLKNVFIVHGEPAQSNELRKEIKSLNIKATLPKKNEEVYLAQHPNKK